jgi:hypothetical protein
MINWGKLTKEGLELIGKITKRAFSDIPALATISNTQDLQMDISAAHISSCMNLKKFLRFDDLNFNHDIFGIIRHIDRQTGTLTDCFLPRCSK